MAYPDETDTGAKAMSGNLVAGPDLAQLGSLARRGVVWTFAQTVLRHVISIGVTAVLARLLAPRDYGLVGMAATLTAFLQIFSDMGLSWATIQRKELTRGQMDNLFWVNTVFGALLWGMSAAAGPALAWFYGQPELSLITAATGASFVLSGIAVQPMALLKRQMRFKQLALAELGSTVAGSAVGLTLAFMGYAYWALVWQTVAAQATRMAALFVASGYRPGWVRTGSGTASLLKLGGWVVACAVLNYFTRNLDRVLLGKYWSAEPLAYYDRAYFLVNVPSLLVTGVAAQVMMPALCAVQNDLVRFERVYLRFVRAISLIALPMSIGLLATAGEIVAVLYGAQWRSVAPVLKIMCLAMILMPLAVTFGNLYLAVGRTDRLWRWTVFTTPAVCLAFVCGLPFGPKGVAAGVATAAAALFLPGLWYGAATANLRVRPILSSFVGPLACACLMGAVVWGVGYIPQVAVLPPAGALAVKIGTGVIIYGSLVLSLQHSAIKELWMGVRDMLGNAPNG